MVDAGNVNGSYTLIQTLMPALMPARIPTLMLVYRLVYRLISWPGVLMADIAREALMQSLAGNGSPCFPTGSVLSNGIYAFQWSLTDSVCTF